MGWSGLEWPGVGWSSLEWIGVGWSGLEWVGVAWSSLEWVGAQFDKARFSHNPKSDDKTFNILRRAFRVK